MMGVGGAWRRRRQRPQFQRGLVALWCPVSRNGEEEKKEPNGEHKEANEGGADM